MPIITRLVAGKKNRNRVNIYLDGVFALAVSIDEIGKRGLAKGQSLSPAQISELQYNDQEQKTYAKILNFISFRPHSVKEVRDRLKKYGVEDPTSQNTYIAKLQSHGYLDDLSFASWFVESRATHRPRSNRHLIAELGSHGVSKDIIAQVLTGLDESASLESLIHKKARSLDRSRLMSYLARRGFAYGSVRAKLDEMGISE